LTGIINCTVKRDTEHFRYASYFEIFIHRPSAVIVEELSRMMA